MLTNQRNCYLAEVSQEVSLFNRERQVLFWEIKEKKLKFIV
jgi:hypothetical protein